MSALATTPRSTTRRHATGAALAGLLLTAALATPAPAGASYPVDHDTPAARATNSVVLVNGVHTMAGVTAKLARLP